MERLAPGLALGRRRFGARAGYVMRGVSQARRSLRERVGYQLSAISYQLSANSYQP